MHSISKNLKIRVFMKLDLIHENLKFIYTYSKTNPFADFSLFLNTADILLGLTFRLNSFFIYSIARIEIQIP